MASNTSIAGPASSNTTKSGNSPGTFATGSIAASIGDPSIHELNSFFSCSTFISGNGKSDISASSIYQAATEQHPILKNSEDISGRMYVKGIRVYGADNSYVIMLTPTIKPGQTFHPRKQMYDIGVTGSTRNHLSHTFPDNIITSHPVDTDSHNVIFKVSSVTVTGVEANWFGWVNFTVHSDTVVDVDTLQPMLTLFGAKPDEIITKDSRVKWLTKRRLELTMIDRIDYVKKMKLPVSDE